MVIYSPGHGLPMISVPCESCGGSAVVWEDSDVNESRPSDDKPFSTQFPWANDGPKPPIQ